MDRLKQSFSVFSTRPRQPVKDQILDGIRYGTSGFEAFGYVNSSSCTVADRFLPDRELLHKPRGNELAFVADGSVEDFYKLCHQFQLDEEVDALILERCLPESLKFNEGVSINLCSRTAYGEKLVNVLDKIPHDPRKVMFEISEAKTNGHSRLPPEYNPKALESLKKKGYRFALDDLDPFRSGELDSLSIFEFIDAVKFPHEIASLLRSGDPDEINVVTHHIWAVSRLCPSATLIMEGIRATDEDLIPLLVDAGVHAYQKSRYVDSRTTQPRPAASLELIH